MPIDERLSLGLIAEATPETPENALQLEGETLQLNGEDLILGD